MKNKPWLIAILTFCLITGCISAPLLAPTPAPTQVSTSTPAPTPTPAPVNAQIMSAAQALTPQNANLITRLADLWPQGQIATNAAFYDAGSLALATGGSYTTAGAGPVMTAVSLGDNPGVILWNMRTNTSSEVLSAAPGKTNYSMLAVSPDHKWIALAGNDRVVLGELQPGSQGQPAFKSRQVDISEILETGVVMGAVFSPDSRFLAVDGQQGGVMIWDVQANSKAAAIPVVITDQNFYITDCMFNSYGAAFSADSQTLIYPCGQSIRTWDFKTGQPLAQDALLGGQIFFAASQDSSLLAMGDYFGVIDLWEFASKKHLAKLTGQATPIVSLAFSPDGSLLASANTDGNVLIWDVQKGTNLATLEAAANYITFSPDGKFIVSGSYMGGGELWGVSSANLQAQRQGVKVRLSEGSIGLSDWNALIPTTWLAPEGSFPRYEIRLNSSWIENSSCTYSGTSGSGIVSRRTPTVSVEIADMETGALIGHQAYTGGAPEACPETWTFSISSPSAFIDGADPDIAPFGPWLLETMGKLGFK